MIPKKLKDMICLQKNKFQLLKKKWKNLKK